MNSPLSEAKKWMSRAARTALVVLPLAAAAVAQAGVMFPGQSGSCSASGFGTAQPACTFSQLAADGAGNQGFQWTLNAPYTDGTYGDFQGFAGGIASGNLASGGSIPFAWTLTTSTGYGRLYFSIFDDNSGDFLNTQIDITPGTTSGSGTFDLASGINSGDVVFFNFNVYPDYIAPVDAPSNPYVQSFSLDVFPVSSTPEPGTVALMGGALGLLALARRRRA